MPISIKMPALSPTMTDGTLAKWLVKEGDEVRSGDVIAEIETDKATMEVEAIDEGIVAVIAVPEGSQNVPVNAVIAMLAEEGEDPKAVAVVDAPAKAPASVPETAEASLPATSAVEEAKPQQTQAQTVSSAPA